MSVDPLTALPSRPSPGAAGARLGELYAEHSRLVYGICRMLLRDPDEAEDATQQVFLSAYNNLLTGAQVRDPAAWLGTIARNACRRRAIARMREPLAVDEELTLVSPAADEQASGREQAAALYAELAALPEKQREAVVLRDLYGLRYDEVAVALGTSRPAVEALLFRGRRRLQSRLRPGFAAGVLVVPLAVQESIAYAVPGFASTAAPAGAVAVAAGVPLLVKLAAAGAAVGIAGSAGIVTERALHDPPPRPVTTRASAPVLPASVPAVERGLVVSSRPASGDGSTGGAVVLEPSERDEDGEEGHGRRDEQTEAAERDEHEQQEQPEPEHGHAAGDGDDDTSAEHAEPAQPDEEAPDPDEDAHAVSGAAHEDDVAEPVAEEDHEDLTQTDPAELEDEH